MPETPQAKVELDQEREYVDCLYLRLDDLRAEKARQLAEVRRTLSAGSHQNRSERDAFATMPDALVMSLITLLLAIAATWAEFRGGWR